MTGCSSRVAHKHRGYTKTIRSSMKISIGFKLEITKRMETSFTHRFLEKFTITLTALAFGHLTPHEPGSVALTGLEQHLSPSNSELPTLGYPVEVST